MTSFAFVTTIASLVIFAGFVILGEETFGQLPSYSAYAAKWTEKVPMHNVYLWSLVTIIVALLLVPAMLEVGEGNLLQCLGFFAPIYLVVVGFTPEWETNPTQKKVHVIGASLCALIATLWIVLVCRLWWVALCALALMLGISIATKRFKGNYVFWGEMALFAATYATVFIRGAQLS